MSKRCYNYDTGDYEDIEESGYSYSRGEYIQRWDDSEYRKEREEEERRRREEEEREEEEERRRREEEEREEEEERRRRKEEERRRREEEEEEERRRREEEEEEERRRREEEEFESNFNSYFIKIINENKQLKNRIQILENEKNERIFKENKEKEKSYIEEQIRLKEQEEEEQLILEKEKYLRWEAKDKNYIQIEKFRVDMEHYCELSDYKHNYILAYSNYIDRLKETRDATLIEWKRLDIKKTKLRNQIFMEGLNLYFLDDKDIEPSSGNYIKRGGYKCEAWPYVMIKGSYSVKSNNYKRINAFRDRLSIPHIEIIDPRWQKILHNDDWELEFMKKSIEHKRVIKDDFFNEDKEIIETETFDVWQVLNSKGREFIFSNDDLYNSLLLLIGLKVLSNGGFLLSPEKSNTRVDKYHKSKSKVKWKNVVYYKGWAVQYPDSIFYHPYRVITPDNVMIALGDIDDLLDAFKWMIDLNENYQGFVLK